MGGGGAAGGWVGGGLNLVWEIQHKQINQQTNKPTNDSPNHQMAQSPTQMLQTSKVIA